MEETKVRQLHTNVSTTDKEDSLKSEETIKRKDVKNTPFEIITIGENSFGAMGSYRITENKESIKEVEKEIKKITWNRLVQVIMILGELKENVNKKQNKK